MQEVRVELAVDVVIPKHDPVGMVNVGVAAEHLLVHVLDLVLKPLWETRRFANPAVCVFGYLLNGRELVPGREVTRGEDGLILALASNPSLDVLHISWSWKVNGVTVGVNPVVEHTAFQFSACKCQSIDGQLTFPPSCSDRPARCKERDRDLCSQPE